MGTKGRRRLSACDWRPTAGSVGSRPRSAAPPPACPRRAASRLSGVILRVSSRRRSSRSTAASCRQAALSGRGTGRSATCTGSARRSSPTTSPAAQPPPIARSAGEPPDGTSQRCTTVQLTVRVMPCTSCTLATTSLPSSSTFVRLAAHDDVIGTCDAFGLGDPVELWRWRQRRLRPFPPRFG